MEEKKRQEKIQKDKTRESESYTNIFHSYKGQMKPRYGELF